MSSTVNDRCGKLNWQYQVECPRNAYPCVFERTSPNVFLPMAQMVLHHSTIYNLFRVDRLSHDPEVANRITMVETEMSFHARKAVVYFVFHNNIIISLRLKVWKRKFI